MGTYLKRCSGFFTLAPGDYEVLTLRLDPKEYESRMVDMGFVKLTSTAYVYETMHSFIDEYDFRFEKPYLHIEVRVTVSSSRLLLRCIIRFKILRAVLFNEDFNQNLFFTVP